MIKHASIFAFVILSLLTTTCKKYNPNGTYLAYKVIDGKPNDPMSQTILDSLKHLYENEKFKLHFKEKYIFLENENYGLNTSMPFEKGSNANTKSYRYSADMDNSGNRTEYILTTNGRDTILTIVAVDCNSVRGDTVNRFGVIEAYLNKTEDL